ncbi:hypothetical protein V6269_20000, partial [Enterobacter roggenkampii]
GTVCVVGKMRDLILQLSKSSIYSTKPTVFYLTKSTDLIITDESRSDEVSRGEAEVTHSIFEC